MDQQQTPQTNTPNLQYGQAFLVFHKPGRFFNNGSRHSDQGILVIQNNTLVFVDIKGHSFKVPLNEPRYQLDRKHRLSVTLTNGDRWAFMGMFESMVVKAETASLASQYGIDRADIGGVDNYIQSLKSQGKFIKYEAITGTALAVSARLGAGAASLGADGVGLAASLRAQYAAASNVLEGYQKVDEFITALRAHGLAVAVAAPSLSTTVVYLGVNRKKNILFLLFNPFMVFFFGFFLVAFVTAPFHSYFHYIGVRSAATALIFITVLDLLLAISSWRLLRGRMQPYKATK